MRSDKPEQGLLPNSMFRVAQIQPGFFIRLSAELFTCTWVELTPLKYSAGSVSGTQLTSWWLLLMLLCSCIYSCVLVHSHYKTQPRHRLLCTALHYHFMPWHPRWAAYFESSLIQREHLWRQRWQVLGGAGPLLRKRSWLCWCMKLYTVQNDDHACSQLFLSCTWGGHASAIMPTLGQLTSGKSSWRDWNSCRVHHPILVWPENTLPDTLSESTTLAGWPVA